MSKQNTDEGRNTESPSDELSLSDLESVAGGVATGGSKIGPMPNNKQSVGTDTSGFTAKTWDISGGKL